MLVLHYPEQRAGRTAMVGDIARLVRPDGRVLIANWTPQTGDDSGSRVSAEETQKMLRKAGFEPDGPLPLGEQQYTITARRMDARRGPG